MKKYKEWLMLSILLLLAIVAIAGCIIIVLLRIKYFCSNEIPWYAWY